MNIGYFKTARYYIIEIDVIDKFVPEYIVNIETASLFAKEFKVISIYDYKRNENLNNIGKYEINKIIKCDRGYKEEYYMDKELAIYNFFVYERDFYDYLQNKTGIYRNYHSNGNIYSEFYHINGLIEGVYKEYTANGHIHKISNYINNKKNGSETIYYYHNNKIEYIYNYINDIKNGECRVYYSNGMLQCSGYYNNNNKVGEWIEYNMNGDILNKFNYFDFTKYDDDNVAL